MKKISVIMAAAIVCSPLAAQEAEEEATAKVAAEEAATEDAAVEEAGEEVEEADDKDRIICRRTEVVGSRFKKRLCGTQHMWDTLANRGRESTAEFQRKGRGIRQAGN